MYDTSLYDPLEDDDQVRKNIHLFLFKGYNMLQVFEVFLHLEFSPLTFTCNNLVLSLLDLKMQFHFLVQLKFLY